MAGGIFTACYNVAPKILTLLYFGVVARALVYLQFYAETEILVKKSQRFTLATKSGVYEVWWLVCCCLLLGVFSLCGSASVRCFLPGLKWYSPGLGIGASFV